MNQSSSAASEQAKAPDKSLPIGVTCNNTLDLVLSRHGQLGIEQGWPKADMLAT